MRTGYAWAALLILSVGTAPFLFGQYDSPHYPRPVFDRATYIPYESLTMALWGESDATGYAYDWIYVSNQKVHQLIFQMPPGAGYWSSERNRVIYGADEVWYVLNGVLAVNNPETGEVHVVNKGEAVFWRKDTWHHGFSYGSEPVRILECFAPPPAAGTTGAYSNSKPFLREFKEKNDQVLGRWPMEEEAIKKTFTLKVMRDSDLLWRREGQALVGLYAATEHLTAGKMILLPGQKSDLHRHGGDEALYLLEGSLVVEVPGNQGQRSFILRPEDGFYIPEGESHQFFNMSDRPLTLIFQVAPQYLAKP